MNLFSYVKGQLSILSVINDYVTLKKAGLYWKGNCPFHAEKTASFTVSPHKEIFYCFGCHVGGDIIAFIAQAENCSPLQAAKHLIDRYSITVPDTLIGTINPMTADERNHYHNLCKSVAQWAHSMLLTHTPLIDYFTLRGITRKSIDYFMLGYFPGGPRAIKTLLTAMQRESFLPIDLLQANIISQGKMVLYSPFEERVLFPIRDHIGRYCGFGGRIYKPIDERAKYYNSRENNYFSKGSLLFGLDVAKQSIQKQEKVFLVEGYTDCIAMVQHGYTNTVATLGTACTLEHLTTLAHYAQQIYVVYDGDKAGQEAILRLTSLCWQVNMELKVISLPTQEDPASFLIKNNDLQPLITQAKDIFLFFITTMANSFTTKTLQEKLQVTKRIITTIHAIDDLIKRDLLLSKASDCLDIPLASLQQVLKKAQKPHTYPVPLSTNNSDPDIPMLEKNIFFAIMNNIQLLNSENIEWLLDYLPSNLNIMLKKLKDAREGNPSLDFIQFFDMLDLHEQHYVSRTLLEGEQESSSYDFEQCMLHLQKRHWKRIVHDIKDKLAQAEQVGDTEKIERILYTFSELKKKMVSKKLM